MARLLGPLQWLQAGHDLVMVCRGLCICRGKSPFKGGEWK